jgi:CDP-diacylglycerol pyrophosphatase
MYKGEEGTKDNWYVAISGMQPLNKKAVSAAGERTYTTWSPLEEKSLEEHYQELMQATEAVY